MTLSAVAPTHLLAKSTTDDPPRGPATLQGHTAFVVRAAEEILRHRCDASLRAVGLRTSLTERLRRIVRLGAFIHDLGKCSAHFQEMVRNQRSVQQLLRHEAVSLLLAWRDPLRAWLTQAVDDPADYVLACAAAVGHHRKYPASAIAPEDVGAGIRLLCFVDHQDFHDTLRFASTVFGLPPPPRLASLEMSVGLRGDVKSTLREFEEAVRATLDSDPTTARPLLAVAKALVLDADVAGSALPPVHERVDWIGKELGNRATAADLDGVVAKRLGGRALRPFQEAVAAATSPVTLVRAGCGTGKTVAAYLWAASQHAGRQLWITYPTTGTAAEGFRDYVHEADVDARLESSRARIDLELLDIDAEGSANRALDRLDAIRAWGTEVVVCTTDTVLGLIQNQRKGLYAWVALCESAVVFDEIHAYDDRLFGALLRFLDCLPGIPTLLMTASLPLARREALNLLVRRRHGIDLPVVEGPPDMEKLPRYRLLESTDPVAVVRATLAAGGKVLWVSNTVSRCIESADTISEPLAPVFVYHSRFRYEDRVRRHADVIEAFKALGPALVCTTQVAEMSLDLSADLLVTDLAPVPALIQRLGRLNRRSTPEAPAPVRDFIVRQPPSNLPYESVPLDDAAEWLSSLRGREVSQHDLITAWNEPAYAVEPAWSAWWDGGPETEPRELREPSPGITVLLPDDAERVRVRPADAPRFALPMTSPPRGLSWKSWPRANHIPVSPQGAIEYDARRGARWRK